ncbi:MAG: SDR family oxidoreductase [Candidatus Wallbacteria bacterium]|nr:SDR family oxidoreductase [Candidatus Wallbacteria bacterium]
MNSPKDFLGVSGKKYLIFGLANKKSVAYFIARNLQESGAVPIFSVQTEEQLRQVEKLFPGCSSKICDLRDPENLCRLKSSMPAKTILDGIVHSVAFANYVPGRKFLETSREDFLSSTAISCFSLVEISHVFKDMLAKDASVVTISISTTRMAAENYGYMAPIKAALESCLCFLAKSFSEFSEVRFNAVCAGLLKTSSSAGIPGYVDSYLFAEQAILRKKNLETQEVADAAVFLLSRRSSGINAQKIIVDAGMETNYFDKKIVEKVVK